MKRYLGLDLGTRTLGIAITDKANIMAVPYTLVKFSHEDYIFAYNEVKKIIEKEKITDVIIGIPKNMDNTLGFASQRSFDFINFFKNDNVEIHEVDERLTTMEASRMLHDNEIHEKDFKNKIDMASAVIILESFLRSIKSANK